MARLVVWFCCLFLSFLYRNILKRKNSFFFQAFCLFLLFSSTVSSQVYKRIGIEQGLSNRRVFAIQKDSMGYMWFLTHEGIDRYDGKEFKFYKLMDANHQLTSLLNLNWLYIDTQGVLWQIGKKGKIFRYNKSKDLFELVYRLPAVDRNNEKIDPISFSFLDRHDRIWLCGDKKIYIYQIDIGEMHEMQTGFLSSVKTMQQIDHNSFFIGTSRGCHHVSLTNRGLVHLPHKALDEFPIEISDLYFDKAAQRLYVGTFKKGIYLYDLATARFEPVSDKLIDVSINQMKPLNAKELLLATDGAGVFKLSMQTHEVVPYVTPGYTTYSLINEASVEDLYVDGEQIIWMANYPTGLTVRDNRYAAFRWIRHGLGNAQSLCNNQVNDIVEDGEGDLWFATNNGISLYQKRTQQWHSYLTYKDSNPIHNSRVFLSLCEVSPGVIWAGGHSSGVYQISKRNHSVVQIDAEKTFHSTVKSEKYIRDIQKDRSGAIWVGGHYGLKSLNLTTKKIRTYGGLHTVTAVLERNSRQMWVSNATGVHLLDKVSGVSRKLKLPVEDIFVYSLYQDKKGILYIGTSGLGLMVYNPQTQKVSTYDSETSSLISNNIYTILPNKRGTLILGTEKGLSSFYPITKKIKNWTQDQGLTVTHFNAHAGLLQSNGQFILGGSNGAVEFDEDLRLPKMLPTKLVFSDFNLFYQKVYPGDENSPLVLPINETKVLNLSYSQNIFSIKVSSINYDYPSNVVYSWKLEGFYDEWTQPSAESTIQLTNLHPGDYVLKVRAVSREDHHRILDEREMLVSIDRPFWLSWWALLVYLPILFGIGYGIAHIIMLYKQRKVSDEKIQFFINTAHDIRTPLTLIKAPLEELIDREALPKDEEYNIKIALRNVNTLLHTTSNLINFEMVNLYSKELYVSEHEIVGYIRLIFQAFEPYAHIKHIDFTFESHVEYLNVWFDKDKMESVIKNVISNALKYTPEKGSVTVTLLKEVEGWSFEVKDTGIGIPLDQQKKLFTTHFRATNAINAKVTGSGIGLMLVHKLVQLHQGTIKVDSSEDRGTTIKIHLPVFQKASKSVFINTSVKEDQVVVGTGPVSQLDDLLPVPTEESGDLKMRLLIVEDNDDLRHYLKHSFMSQYVIETCHNGKEALSVVSSYNPDLIISDIMMPEMRGDDLCHALKSSIETSHIPIILLTALSDDKNILSGLQTGADEYIVKPFKISLLRAKVASMLANRKRLRAKYANLELTNDPQTHTSAEAEMVDMPHDMDWNFISSIKTYVETHMSEPTFSIDALCADMNMSRTSFYNKLKALTGQAPNDYIRLIRLKKATEFLKEGRYSITEIADMTGFNDAKYFREVFKKHYNVSPSQYYKERNNE